MSEFSERTEPFQLKGGSFTTVVLKLIDPTNVDFFTQLKRRIRQAPALFKNAPVVIDLEDLAPEIARFDASSLGTWLRSQDLIPIGIQGGTEEQQQEAIAAGLPIVPPPRNTTTVMSEAKAQPTPIVEERGSRAAMVVKEPVRSGRRIYAAKGDLVVLAPVSPGAELLADGHIHIYNTLRGRALAGLNGDRNARIFCQSLEAELVSIAGLYRVSEDIEKKVLKKSVQIFLEADRLRMDVLS
jgi:septum site-determining protein MinC